MKKDLIIPNQYMQKISKENDFISPISIGDLKLFNKFFKNSLHTYGNSWSYIVQSTYDIGPNNLGYKYYDGDNIVAMSLYPHMEYPDKLFLHWTRPMGNDIVKIINKLSDTFIDRYQISSYIKKLFPNQFSNLKTMGWNDTSKFPWHSTAPSSDDTLPEVILDVQKTLKIAQQGTRKEELRRTYVRTETRLKRHDISFTSEKFEEKAWDITKQFFKNYKKFGNKELLSNKDDYNNMISNNPNRKNITKIIVEVNNDPQGFYITERINDYKNLVAHIALRDEYKYLIDLSTFHILKNTKCKYLNLGGSEDKGIFNFNKKYNPIKLNQMHWAVKLSKSNK